MKKPKDMTVKEWIVRKMSTKMVISERVINQVILHQFDSTHDALKLNNSVELSGFGKFLFNIKKAKNHVKKLESIKTGYELLLANINTPEKKANFVKSKLSRLNLTLMSLKPKLDDKDKRDIRGMEE
jgi:nucleoid DNA-binding protein